jgi:hypothetical protein
VDLALFPGEPPMAANSIEVEQLRIVPLAIRQYIAREQLWASSYESQRTTLDLNRAMAAAVEYGLDLSAVFWATQSKDKQICYCASYNGVVSLSTTCFCAKCGHWIPIENMPEHLAVPQMKRATTVHPAELWKVPDATDICLAMKRLPHAHIRDQNGRLAVLRQADWPEICQQCHLLVMHSYMSVHKQSRIFCDHACLTKAFSPGVGSLNRFSWYPGNPLLHFHKVEKFQLLALTAYHSAEIKELRTALIPLLVATGLYSFGIDGHPIANILDYLLAPPTSALWTLLSLVLNTSSGNAAIWVYKRSIRNLLLRFESNLFGEVIIEPSNSIPLGELLLPHEVPVPSDDSEDGNAVASDSLPVQPASSSSRTPFFSASTVAALEAGFHVSQFN